MDSGPREQRAVDLRGDRSSLERPVLRHRVRRRDLDSLFERAALKQIETGDWLIGSGHRTVGDLQAIVAATNRLRLPDGFEDVTHESYPAIGEIRRPILDFTGECGLVLRREFQIGFCTDLVVSQRRTCGRH